jgi:hypothetical protein
MFYLLQGYYIPEEAVLNVDDETAGLTCTAAQPEKKAALKLASAWPFMEKSRHLLP